MYVCVFHHVRLVCHFHDMTLYTYTHIYIYINIDMCVHIPALTRQTGSPLGPPPRSSNSEDDEDEIA